MFKPVTGYDWKNFYSIGCGIKCQDFHVFVAWNRNSGIKSTIFVWIRRIWKLKISRHLTVITFWFTSGFSGTYGIAVMSGTTLNTSTRDFLITYKKSFGTLKSVTRKVVRRFWLSLKTVPMEFSEIFEHLFTMTI